MTNLALKELVKISTLIYLPYWALNGMGPIAAENLWKCVENVESCRVVNFECPENHKNIFFNGKITIWEIFIFWQFLQMRFCNFFVFCVLLSKLRKCVKSLIFVFLTVMLFQYFFKEGQNDKLCQDKKKSSF